MCVSMNIYYSLKIREHLLQYTWANAQVFRICSTPPWNERRVDISLLNEELGRVACFATENVRRHHLAYLIGQSLHMLALFVVAAHASDLLLEKSGPGVATAPSPTPQMKIIRPGLEHSCYSQLHWPGKKSANGCCWKPRRRAGRVTVEKITSAKLDWRKEFFYKKYVYRNNISNVQLTSMLDIHVSRLTSPLMFYCHIFVMPHKGFHYDAFHVHIYPSYFYLLLLPLVTPSYIPTSPYH